jgi:hypothetical protein
MELDLDGAIATLAFIAVSAVFLAEDLGLDRVIGDMKREGLVVSNSTLTRLI